MTTELAGSSHHRIESGEGDLDALVDLHVLAEHGDTEAAAAAARWIAVDPEARRRWSGVERVCAELRGTGPSE